MDAWEWDKCDNRVLYALGGAEGVAFVHLSGYSMYSIGPGFVDAHERLIDGHLRLGNV